MHYFDGMKAVTINISLNPELAEFARSDSEAHAFDSMSEYMRDLIRNRRQQQIKRDVAYLEKAIEGAPVGDPSDEEMPRFTPASKPGGRKKMKVVFDAGWSSLLPVGGGSPPMFAGHGSSASHGLPLRWKL